MKDLHPLVCSTPYAVGLSTSQKPRQWNDFVENCTAFVISVLLSNFILPLNAVRKVCNSSG